MGPPKTRSKSAIAGRFLAGMLLPLMFGSGQAQTTTQNDCGANECFSPAFDVGIVYQSPVGQYGITDLMYAVEVNNLAKVEALLAAGADVNARNDAGATALLMAAAYGSRDIVDRLLAAGADPDIISHRGDAPLISAIQHGHAEIAVALLKRGANANINDPRLRNGALVKAAVLGQTDVVRLLLDLGVETQASGLEALSLALWKNHEDIVALLLETDMDLNAPTYDTKKHTRMQTGEFVLQTAAQQGLQLATAMLLENGADVNRRNIHGESALYFAVRNNHPEIVSVLLDAGAIVAGDDLAAAIDAGNEVTVEELMLHLDVSALETPEIDTLILKADSTNNKRLLKELFNVLESRTQTEPVTTLLFARADTKDCELIRWDLTDNRQKTVFSGTGKCEEGFFFSRSRAELYVVGQHDVSVISLDAPESVPQMVQLPTAMIDKNLATLEERVKAAYNNRTEAGWMDFRIVQFGVLESGEFAFVTHAGGPADETYGYLYALFDNSWRLVRNQDCHRFDPCRFDEVSSRSLSERPGNLTIWSPEIRRNPYFVDKAESREVLHDDVGWNGVVTFNIDGQPSLLHYSKSESGHCMEDCTYTSGLRLELPDQSIPVAKFAGNNAIVGRYVLVSTRPWPGSQLIDLGTGKSVLGDLQAAGWLH